MVIGFVLSLCILASPRGGEGCSQAPAGVHDRSSGSQRVLSPPPTEHTLRDLGNGHSWTLSDPLHPTWILSHSLGDGHSCPGGIRQPPWPGMWGRALPESCAMGVGGHSRVAQMKAGALPEREEEVLWRCSELDSDPQNMVSTQNLRT